jgi:hypothetical protein
MVKNWILNKLNDEIKINNNKIVNWTKTRKSKQTNMGYGIYLYDIETDGIITNVNGKEVLPNMYVVCI